MSARIIDMRKALHSELKTVSSESRVLELRGSGRRECSHVLTVVRGAGLSGCYHSIVFPPMRRL